MGSPQSCCRAKSRCLYTRCLLVIVAAAWLTPAVLAQTAAPPRDANRWNGIAHQPTRATIAAQEQQAGIALSNEQKRHEDQDLRRIESGLLQNADREFQ
jgi:hypothetical protein